MSTWQAANGEEGRRGSREKEGMRHNNSPGLTDSLCKCAAERLALGVFAERGFMHVSRRRNGGSLGVTPSGG